MTATIQIHRGAGYDANGDPIDPTPIAVIDGWKIAPRTQGSSSSSSEVEARGRQGVIVGLTAYSEDPTADVTASDQVEILDGLYAGSHLWDVEGEIGRWPMGVEMALKRSAG